MTYLTGLPVYMSERGGLVVHGQVININAIDLHECILFSIEAFSSVFAVHQQSTDGESDRIGSSQQRRKHSIMGHFF